jgi:chromosome segregation ATPase
LEELQKLLTRTQLDLDKRSRENEEMKSSLSRLQNERDSLQQQLAAAQESNKRPSLETRDETTDTAVKSLQMKNSQLQNSLADIESLYRSLCAEKSQLEQSFEITTTRFKSILSEKESLQSSLCKERKRITWCNKVLQDASQSASSLITELHAEIQGANGTIPASEEPQSPKSDLSENTSESKTLMHHAEVLQQQLRDLRRTNQQLVLSFQHLIPEADELQQCFKRLEVLGADEQKHNSLTMLDEQAVNDTLDTTAGSDSSGEVKIIKQMLENASQHAKNGKVDGDMKRLVTSLENEMRANSKSKRDKSNSPTNGSPTLTRALSMRRLWRKKSGP